MSSCESFWNEDAQIPTEKINKTISPNNPGFIDVNRTVQGDP